MADEENDVDLFEGIPAFDEFLEETEEEARQAASPHAGLPTREELERLSPGELVDHATFLQEELVSLQGEVEYLSWEFRDCQKNIVNFSRAAKLAHELNSADTKGIAEIATEDIRSYFDCGFAALFLYNPETDTFDLYRSTLSGDEAQGLSFSSQSILADLFVNYRDPFVISVVDGKDVIAVDNGDVIEGDIPVVWRTAIGGKALIFPLCTKQATGVTGTLGGLVMGAAKRPLVVTDAEVAAFFSDLLSSELYNSQLLKKLNDLTIIDPLTQIYNRRHLMNQLNMAMVQSVRNRHPLSVVMIDIDFFKRFNDQYGHICGDEVLRTVAATIKNSIRTGVDVPARYGGEEFILVMPFTDLATGVQVADRLRVRIKDLSVRFQELELSVTCSMGLAEFEPGESLERLIDRADEALYLAKKTGRDRVCSTDDLVG